jgi:uncharacterized circularly permuted ATP-grasp superfamily protein/uncharacterized alpha-E superfamily protein
MSSEQQLRSLYNIRSHDAQVPSSHDLSNPLVRDFLAQLEIGGLEDLNRRTLELDAQIQDNGITYNVYADDNGPQRPWSLGLLPLVITPESWRKIESGVLQRAQLLENIMADVYGPQDLLKAGLIPPALVHGHPGYLRPMRDAIRQVGGQHLHIIAFDLACGPDDEWAVLSQRAQAPSGLGYLLENRSLISQQFPRGLSALGVQSLADAYRALMNSLKRLSPKGDSAHIALLTPGPYNETYFEHAYLARYLGLTLVEGSDLTVRDGHLFLRTIKGLEPVHVLLKRLDDEYLDPLELRSDSTLGVPGLLQAVRAGNVVVANAPGSGFLESPALLGFLPAISETLLGQTLQLPAMDTWWCGEEAALKAALTRLSQRVIKPTYPLTPYHTYFETTLAKSLTPEAVTQWHHRITADPLSHTLQSHIPLAQMLVWQAGQTAEPGQLVSRSYMLRVFALRDGENSWRVLPGGLARVASNQEDIASMQRGGSSADVWVQADPDQISKAQAQQHATDSTPTVIERRRTVTSRSAENLYWLGRYTERSENTIRLARLCIKSLNAETAPSARVWAWLEQMAYRHGLVPLEAPSVGAEQVSTTNLSTTHQALNDLARGRLFERTLINCLARTDHAASVGFNLHQLRRTASVVRERLAPEQWTMIEKLVVRFDAECAQAIATSDYSTVKALTALTHANRSLAAITGAQVDRMTRDDGWQLLSIGRHVERLGFHAQSLDLAIQYDLLDPLATDATGMTNLLVLFDSIITFRAQYQQSREITALVDLIVMDAENPRSLACITRNLIARLSKLANTPIGEPDAIARLVPQSAAWPTMLRNPSPAAPALPALADIARACAQAAWHVSEAVDATYFSHRHGSDHSIGA